MKKDLRVLYLDRENIVRCGFGSIYHASVITGPTNLIQKIVYYLLTETGSNYFSPTAGSAFAAIDSVNWSPDNQNVIKASITNSILDIENKIKLSQIQNKLEPEESLNKLQVTNIEYEASEYAWRVTLEVTNLLNQTFTVNI
ncbi:MAG: hypothetical protein KBD37_09760 [Burkholderiales bacterium]|nr:hypothetical protein [Burkholderiales bacterium]